MMFNTLLLATLPLMVVAQPDFTFRCNPCFRTSFPESQRACEISNSDAVITIDHPDIGTVTCDDIWRGVNSFVFNPEQCGAIQAITLQTSDPCGCVVAETDDYCAPLPATNVDSCDFCNSGKKSRIGDENKVIDNTIWQGNTCAELVQIESTFDFSASQCDEAQLAVATHCQCYDTENLDEVLAVQKCHLQEDSQDPCYPDDDNDRPCCIGTCAFRLSEQDYVCTTKAPQEVPNGYTPPSVAARLEAEKEAQEQEESGIDLGIDWGSFAPGAGACSSIGGSACDVDDDCCSPMSCAQGSANHKVCVGSTGGINKPSAGAGGGAGGSGRGGAGGQGRKLEAKLIKNKNKHTGHKHGHSKHHGEHNKKNLRRKL